MNHSSFPSTRYFDFTSRASSCTAARKGCGMSLLESAIAQPRQAFGGEYLHADLAAMAAAYLYHIVQNHPFLDGNKRTGAAAAIVFLKMNGAPLIADEEGLEMLVLAVACGEAEKEQVAKFFRDHIRTDSRA